MATRFAFWLNLDADLELENPTRYATSHAPSGRIAAWVARLGSLLSPHDLLLNLSGQSTATADDPTRCTAIAFCPTPSALRGIRDAGFLAPAAPPLEVIRAVNHRAFSAQLGQTLSGAAFVYDLATLEATVRGSSPTGSFVIKRPHSFAGRDRRLCHRGELDRSTLGFCRNALTRGEGLQVEPWVERQGDFALHGYVTAAGAIRLGEPRLLRCDAMGRFQGAAPAPPTSLTAGERETLHGEGVRTAHALLAAGYFGPFGIDAFRYCAAGGASAFNPRCEINARLTMGFPRELLLAALQSGDESS